MGFFKHLFSSPVFRVAAPIALGLALPGLGTALAGSAFGTGLGLSTAGATGLAGALGGGAIGGLEGGGLKGIGTGAALGGVGGYIQGAGGIGNALSQATSGTPLAGAGSSLSSGLSSVSNGLGSLFGGSPSDITASSSFPSSGATLTNSTFDPSSLSGSGGNLLTAGGTASGGGIGSMLSSWLSKLTSNPSNLLSAGANIFSGIQGTQAAKQMAGAQLESTNAALAQQAKQYGQTQANLNPFMTAGQSANRSLTDYLGLSGNTGAQGYGSLTKPFSMSDFTADPGYQFRLDQGTKAMNQTLGAQGNLFSGAALKSAQDFGQGLADQTYNDAYNRYNTNNNNTFNRLNTTASAGQNAASGLGNFGSNFANQTGILLQDTGNVRANQVNNSMGAVNQSLANIFGAPVGGFSGGGSSQFIFDPTTNSYKRMVNGVYA